MKRLDGILPSILHGRPVYVYGVSVAVAAFPAVLAVFLQVHRARHGFAGYYTHPNFYSLVGILPAALWLLRLMVRVLSPIRVDGPVVHLFHPDHRMPARQALYREVIDARNLMLSLLVMVIYHFLHTADVLNVYWQRWFDSTARVTTTPAELDWSVFFLIGTTGYPGSSVIGMKANLAFVLLAYTAQFFVGVVAILALVVLARHNVFFVRHIFQRRRAAAGPQERYVSIDLRDPDCLFGFGPANSAFSLQVAVTSLAGVLLLASHFRNTRIGQFQGLYDLAISVSDFTETVGKLLTAVNVQETLGDNGQWMLVVSWLGIVAIVLIPAIVKFLPRCSRRGPNLTATEFLREFIPPAASPGDDYGGEVMKDFERNSFWSAGDGKARWYFTGAFFVFLLLFYPVRAVTGRAVKPLLYVALLAVAYVGTALVFRVLKASLTYVDGRLGSQSD